MAGISTSPSGGFFSRMMGQMPGMTNSLAQNFGDPSMRGAVQGSSRLLGMQKPSQPKMPKYVNGLPDGQLPGMQIPMPSMPSPINMGGIDTGPSRVPMPENNSGIAGGLFNRPPGYERPGQPNSGGGGLFSNYRPMSGPGQTPFGYRF